MSRKILFLILRNIHRHHLKNNSSINNKYYIINENIYKITIIRNIIIIISHNTENTRLNSRGEGTRKIPVVREVGGINNNNNNTANNKQTP
jgi:hypothetical protein